MPPATLDTYTSRPPMGRAGQISDLSIAVIDTFINESATPIEPGAPVVRGASAVAGHSPTGKPMGADTDQFVGIAVEFPLDMVANSSDVVNYVQRSAVPTMRVGKIWVTALEQVRRGDAVLIVTASNAFASPMGGVAGAGRVLVANAEWETDTAAGAIGEIYIRGGATGRLTA